MNTIWDWITVIAFGALIVLLLSRSSQDNPSDRLAQYVIPAAGCAIANQIGNHYSDLLAAGVLAFVLVYVHQVLKWPPAGFFRSLGEMIKPDR